MANTLHVGFVLTNQGTYLLQLPADNQWGFSLYSASGSWPGGFGVASSWEPVAADRVPAKVRDRMEWLLDDGVTLTPVAP